MRLNIRILQTTLLLISLMFISLGQVWAVDVALAWDASSSSGVTGYKVYYGNASRTYGSPLTVGNQTSYTVTGLSAGTFYFAVTAFDTSGSESDYSNEVSTTIANPSAPIVTITAPTSNATYSASASPLSIGGTASDDVGVTQVTWTNSQGGSGTATGTANWSATGITLAAGSNVLTVTARDAAGNTGTDTFTVTYTPPDTTPPVISAVASSNISSTGATITWTTNEASDSQIEYGATTSYGSTTTLNSNMLISHSQAISGLTANTLYHYRLKSKDAAGNLATSGDYTLTTTGTADTTAPTLSSVSASNISSAEATIIWITNEASGSQVDYGTTTAYGSSTILDNTMVISHSRVLSGLSSNTPYHYRVKSRDAAGNLATSGDYTFTTKAYTSIMPFQKDASSVAANEVYVGMAVTNVGSNPATITFTAFDNNGNMVAGSGITNPAVVVLNPGRQLPIVDIELFGSSLSQSNSNGWIRIDSTTTGVRGFFLMFDEQTSLTDGTAFVPSPLRNFVFTEIETNGYTLLNIFNNNPTDTNVNFDLVTANGTVRSTKVSTVKAHGSIAADLYADLFSGITPDATSYIRMSAANGVEPFEIAQQGSGDIASLAGQDTSAGATTLYSPQYVYDNLYRTSLSIVNLDSRSGNVSLRLIGEDGVQMGITRNLSLPASGKLYVNDPAFFQNQSHTEGYVVIVSDGIRLAGNALFGDRNRRTFTSALPLVSSLQQSLVFSHIVSDDLYFTGLAIVNPGSANATVTLDLYTADGSLIDTTSLSIPAGRRECRLLTEYFSWLTGMNITNGYVKLSSNTPVAAFSLFGTHVLSILSAVPAQPIQ